MKFSRVLISTTSPPTLLEQNNKLYCFEQAKNELLIKMIFFQIHVPNHTPMKIFLIYIIHKVYFRIQ